MGLKQALCILYFRVDEYALKLSFTKTTADPHLYYLFDRSDLLVLVYYVEDLVIIVSSEKLIAWCKTELACEFDMKDIISMHFFGV